MRKLKWVMRDKNNLTELPHPKPLPSVPNHSWIPTHPPTYQMISKTQSCVAGHGQGLGTKWGLIQHLHTITDRLPTQPRHQIEIKTSTKLSNQANNHLSHQCPQFDSPTIGQPNLFLEHSCKTITGTRPHLCTSPSSSLYYLTFI